MKTLTRLLFLILAVALPGCREDEQPPDHAEGERLRIIGPQYSARHGLLIPEETRQSLRLTVSDVTEALAPRTLALQLRVYKMTEAGFLATSLVESGEAKLLSPDLPVLMRARQGGELAGKVLSVEPFMLEGAGLSEVVVAAPSAGALPEMGDFLEGVVTFSQPQSVIAIPRSALLQCADGPAVYTLNGEHFVRARVQAGAHTADWVEITDGLYAGDQVVSHPPMALWMTELAAVKAGQGCCVVPEKGK